MNSNKESSGSKNAVKDNRRRMKSGERVDQSPLKRTAQLRIVLQGDRIRGILNGKNERLILPGIRCAYKMYAGKAAAPLSLRRKRRQARRSRGSLVIARKAKREYNPAFEQLCFLCLFACVVEAF